MTNDEPRPRVSKVLETSLYVEDLDRSTRFYQSLFGFEELVRDDRLCALGVGGEQVLLLFKKGLSRRPGVTAGGTIPPHDASGEIHTAFGVTTEQFALWEERLKRFGVAIESSVRWPAGGKSIYFRDPDNHSIELATPGTWTIY